MNLSPGREIGGGAGGGCHAPQGGRRHLGVAKGVGFVERVRSRGCHRRGRHVTVQAKDEKICLFFNCLALRFSFLNQLPRDNGVRH